MMLCVKDMDASTKILLPYAHGIELWPGGGCPLGDHVSWTPCSQHNVSESDVNKLGLALISTIASLTGWNGDLGRSHMLKMGRAIVV